MLFYKVNQWIENEMPEHISSCHKNKSNKVFLNVSAYITTPNEVLNSATMHW